MFKKMIMAIWCISSIVSGMMPEYVNVVTEIQEIHGGSTYSLILKCTEQDPIIVYAPATHEESISDEIYRSFMPGTTLAPDVADSSGVVEQTGSGVEIVLLGRLKEKIVVDYTVILVVEVAESLL